MQLDPSQSLNCLLIQPKFEETNFWNFIEGAHAIGARAMAPPLGLLTVAALLPQHWQFRLVDLNAQTLTECDWQWADLVCSGGMLPQQADILALVARANRDGKYIVLGGPDPTSQPELYENADALVLGEGEASIPLWLSSWKKGQPSGTFLPDRTVDVTQTPLPRFDLIKFDNYLNAGIQSSRGCPYNCEFCDVIELFGRKPRVKTPGQFVAELQNLYDAGYRGWVDIHDDNFIGNRLKIKPLLEAAAAWMKEHNYPFVLSTEASVNLADDDELLELMQECQFRYVFLGIETPEPEVLKQTQKRINTVKPLIGRIRRLYDAGIAVTAGFILGFDAEPEGVDKSLVPFIQESGISMAMVGLLFAMPNTQLTRRLRKEGRLISHRDGWIPELSERYQVRVEQGIDHTSTGLNFVTMRDRVDIYRELKAIISAIL
ncbi:MAG: radical SAM protein [Pirellulales bacterium]